MNQQKVALIRLLKIRDCRFANIAPLTIKSVLRCIHDSEVDGICHRTHESIANELQVTRKTILASVRELKAMKLIETEFVFKQPLKIRINWSRVEELVGRE